MIPIKSKSELEKIRRTCRIVARTIEYLRSKVKAGTTTKELDREASQMIKKLGGRSAFFGYRGFPGHICTSINEEVVHGIPGPRMLLAGDIISLDVGVEYKGYFGDAAVTFPVDGIGEKAKHLIEVTKKSLDKAIEIARRRNHLSDISHCIQKYVEQEGFSVVREFVGHGIGASMHEEPQIPNFGNPGAGIRLEPGMVLAIEPMVNFGTWEVEILNDGWTAVTKDRKLSAHFEHTVCITDSEAEVLTVL